MAIEIITQPDVFKPAMVRNPIGIRMETDNYIVLVVGRKTTYKTSFAYMAEMTVGASFEIDINDGAIVETFTVAAVPSNENEIQPRSDYAGGLVGGNLYIDHIASVLSAHSVLSTKIVASNNPDVGFNITLASLINENLIIAVTNTSGDYVLTHTLIKSGIADEYESRSTVIHLNINTVAEGAPVADDQVVFELDGATFTFVFKLLPNTTGYQLPLIGGMSTPDYQDQLLSKFRAAPCFFEKWEITTATVSGEIQFIFTSIGFHTGSCTGTNNTDRFTFDDMPGYQAEFQPNFTVNLVLYCEQVYNSNVFKKIIDMYHFAVANADGDYQAKFRIDKHLYDFMLKTYKENLAEALPYAANLPIAKHLLKKFYFKFFEFYGNPAVSQMIEDSIPYFGALYGAGHMAFVDRKELDSFGLLHPGQASDNPMSLKQYVDEAQPAWLYFYFQPSDSNDIGSIDRVYYKAYFTDGTTAEADILDASLFTVATNSAKTFFVKAGYTQLNLAALNTVDKSVYQWDVIVSIDGDFTMTKRFVLDCCSSYKTFLAYQNSYGGYETVTITAPKEFTLDLKEGNEIERILDDDYELHDSQFESTIPKARQQVKTNLGYKKSSDFDIMKELLLSKFVFLIPKGTTDVFIPVNIDKKSVQLENEDEFEKNFSFEFAPAHEFKNFEHSLWLK